MADSVKDILHGLDSFHIGSSKGGDIDSRVHSTGSQGAQKSNTVDGLSVSCQNAAKSHVPSQSNPKGANQKDRPANGIVKDRGERVRQLREKQQMERQQKLQELKDHAIATQKMREQHDLLRRQRLDEMRQRDSDRRQQVEERRRLLNTAELERKEASIRRNSDRDSRIELKRKQERSNIVFAFGSSTPRMLDPKESSYGYWGSRKATSSSNVNAPDASLAIRRPNLTDSADLSRKRATSAHSLNRKPDGDDIMSQSMTATTPTAARRRTDLFPVVPAARGTNTSKCRHRTSGVQSGSTTPNSSSRPASALSQGSSGNQVVLRSKMAPRKPRPLTIAGSSFTYADKPRTGNSTAGSLTNRESRPTDRKSYTGSTMQGKLTRAKSAGGSDTNVTATGKAGVASRPASTAKRTPAQVKAESAARKAAEKSKAAGQKRQTPPLTSPIKLAPSQPTESDVKSAEAQQPEQQSATPVEVIQPVAEIQPVAVISSEPIVQPPVVEIQASEPEPVEMPQSETKPVEIQQSEPTEPVVIIPVPESDAPSENADPDPTRADRPATGYANEEQYKAALAENRRLAREAKERELELEKQKELEAKEREKKEEEDYLRLMEEQKMAEEERLKKAIEEAKCQRELEAKRKEEEEIQRVEAEKIEKQKQLEAMERMRQEEVERQARKSRVAAIMSRTRGKGAPKGDGKSPDELRGADNLTDSFMANISSSMSDSMIVEAIESRQIEGESEEQLVVTTSETVKSVVTEEKTTVEQKIELVEKSEHLNGGSHLESSNGDLIESVNGDVHNGAVTNGKTETTLVNQFDSFDPFSPAHQIITTDSQSFDEIIDLTQSRLTNEDVVNSNPPTPIIAFEENINKKQSQDASSTNVPDLLL